MRLERDRRGLCTLVPLLALSIIVLALAPARPAGATIASISPSSATVQPGSSITTTVRVQAAGLTCLSARPSTTALTVELARECDDTSSWSSLLTVTASESITPGTYSVRVTDQESGDGGGRTFTVRVGPEPTTAPPVTTTTLAATTTVPPTTTTSSTTTTRPATTTAPSTVTTSAVAASTTTSKAPPPPGGGFFNVASLVDAGVPDEGLFLPLTTTGYLSCLPLTEACVDEASGVVLVPARTTEVAWRVAGPDETTAPRTQLQGLRPLTPVGRAPTDPGAQDYALPVLDLSTEGGQLRTIVRGLDERGQLVAPRAGPTFAVPVAEGPMAQPNASTFVASAPFGRPRLATKGQLTEASPVIALFAATELQVIYALRPDPTWGLNVDLLPLLGDGIVPYLVRGVDGPPGLYVARPEGLRVPTAGSTLATEPQPSGRSAGGISPALLLAGAVGTGMLATIALAIRRRRDPH